MAKLDTDLYYCTISDEEEQVYKDTFARRLVQFDGILGFWVYRREVSIQIDKTMRDVWDAKRHLDDLLYEAALPGTSYFPYLTHDYHPNYQIDVVDVR